MLNTRTSLERAVLGCLLYPGLHGKPGRTREVSIRPEDFNVPDNRAIYEALQDIDARGGSPELMAVAELARVKGHKVAGEVAALFNEMVTDTNLPIYVERLREVIWSEKEETLRQESATRLKNGEDQNEVAEDIKARSQQLEERYGAGKAMPSLADAVNSLIDRARNRTPHPNAVLTWVDFIDRMVVAFLPGEYGCLAAYPSVGKSALGLQIALSRASHHRKTGIISLEMDGESIAGRALATITGEDTRPLLRRPEALTDQAQRAVLGRALESRELARHILVEENPMITLDQIAVRARQFKREGADLVIIDYFQLLEGEPGENRNLQLAAVSRRLKCLARDLGLVIIALSQFSNDAAKSKREPCLHDLRDTGAIGQDVDFAFILHLLRRDDTTGADTVKFKLEKGRNVGVGFTTLIFKRSIQKFAEVSYGG